MRSVDAFETHGDRAAVFGAAIFGRRDSPLRMPRTATMILLVVVTIAFGIFVSVSGGESESPQVAVLVEAQAAPPAQNSSAGGEAAEAPGAEDVAAGQLPPPERGGVLERIKPLRLSSAPSNVSGVTCPAYRFRGSKSADAKHTHEAMVKYTRYVGQYCNATGLLQMHVDLSTYLRFLDTVARIVKLKQGDFIFDWGSGCGTMLNYYGMTHGTTGVGIDVTEAAVVHARAHARGEQLFCHMDGSDLRTFPTEAFDAVVSWATLYHVRRTLVQCEIVHHLVRMLKPGGVAYIGHLRTEKTQEYWKKNKCHPPNATIVRYRDARTFHMPAFRRNNFFSLVVTKANATA